MDENILEKTDQTLTYRKIFQRIEKIGALINK